MTRQSTTSNTSDRSSAQNPPSLRGRHIGITRPLAQAHDLAVRLEAQGARVTALPAIAIAPNEDTGPLDIAIGELDTFDWIVFTSVNGVQAFVERLAALGKGWEARGLARIAAIGPATARELESSGATAEVVPESYVAEALAEALGNVAGQRVLLPRADLAREALAQELGVRGAEVVQIAAYHTVIQPIPAHLLASVFGPTRVTERAAQGENTDGDAALDRLDALTFTSSSTVRGLLTSLEQSGYDSREALRGVTLAAIGPITATTLREHGFEPSLVAQEYTVPGLVAALVAYFSDSSR